MPLQAKDRRERRRVPARFPVDCVHAGNFLISYSANISADGMFVCTDRPLPVGTYLQLVFSIGELHEVAVAAKVAWINANGAISEPGMGVQFIDPPESLREMILSIVNRVAVLEPESAGP
ncbi:MAG: TIGR02266 family protein [Thermodesulfobacteriota bacterium]